MHNLHWWNLRGQWFIDLCFLFCWQVLRWRRLRVLVVRRWLLLSSGRRGLHHLLGGQVRCEWRYFLLQLRGWHVLSCRGEVLFLVPGGHILGRRIRVLYHLQWRYLCHCRLSHLFELCRWHLLRRRSIHMCFLRSRYLCGFWVLILRHVFRWYIRHCWIWSLQSLHSREVLCSGCRLMHQLRGGELFYCRF
jgi:hypothetical protein